MRCAIRRALVAAAALLLAAGAVAEEYFTGDGGAGKSISVERPKVQNVGDDVSWLPDYANNVISDDIKKYSHIEVVERRYEAAVSSALAHEEGAEYADDGVEVGNFKAAKSQLQVSIIGKGTSYNVSVTVIDKSTLTSQASFNEDCGYASLENGAVLGKAVAGLLGQLGVNLTDKARGELLTSANAVPKQSIEAQKLVAKAQQAQAAGQNIEAMRLAMAASHHDESLERAAVTKTRVSQAVSSGDMGANVRNAIKRRDEMEGLIDETDEYYQKHTPYTLVYDPELKQGDINYKKRTFTVMFKAAVIRNSSIADDYNMIANALRANPEWKDWGLEPLQIFPSSRITFKGSILNAKGELIASSESHIDAESFKMQGRTMYKAFGSGEFSDSVSADKDTEGLWLRVDKVVDGDNVSSIPFYTVSDYCTQVWQSYIDSGAALPPGIGMFEEYFCNASGFHKPRLKMDATWAKSNEKMAKYFDHDTNEFGDVYISGIADDAADCESIIIPRTIGTGNVMRVSRGAFRNNTMLKSVTFEACSGNGKNRLCVDADAFANCTSLRTVTVQKGAHVYFADWSCLGCTLMNAIIVEEDADAVFGDCGYAKTIIVHKGAKACFGDKLFLDCPRLETITIQDGASIQFCKSAFKNCTSLKTVTIPAGAACRWFAKDVFKGCTSLSDESKAAIKAAGYKGKF